MIIDQSVDIFLFKIIKLHFLDRSLPSDSSYDVKIDNIVKLKTNEVDDITFVLVHTSVYCKSTIL